MANYIAFSCLAKHRFNQKASGGASRRHSPFGFARVLIKRTTRKSLPALQSNAGKLFLGLGLSAKRCKLFSRKLYQIKKWLRHFFI